MGQSSSSLVLSVIKTDVPLDCDDPANQDLLLQQYGERIEKLLQQDKLSNFCVDAEFLNVLLRIGQYFRTKDIEDLTQFYVVACREYTLPRDDWIITTKRMDPRETQKLDPCWKLHDQLHCMANYGVEIRIWSLSEDNTHS